MLHDVGPCRKTEKMTIECYGQGIKACHVSKWSGLYHEWPYDKACAKPRTRCVPPAVAEPLVALDASHDRGGVMQATVAAGMGRQLHVLRRVLLLHVITQRRLLELQVLFAKQTRHMLSVAYSGLSSEWLIQVIS